MTTDKKNFLRDILDADGVAFVRFRKINGEVRNMICTTSLDLIPKDKQPKTNFVYDSMQIRVFDLVAKEWRSMIGNTIIEVREYPSKVSKG